MNIDTSWASRIELDVFRMLRYCKMSGTVIKRSARRNLRPTNKQTLKHDSPYKTHINNNDTFRTFAPQAGQALFARN